MRGETFEWTVQNTKEAVKNTWCGKALPIATAASVLPESTAGQAQQTPTASRQLPHPIMPKGPVKRHSYVTLSATGPFMRPQVRTPARQRSVALVLPVSVVQRPTHKPVHLPPQWKLEPLQRGHIAEL